MSKKSVGELGENIAGKFLEKKGYKILERNYRCKEGEIDIVAEHKESLVFVEVRTKTTSRFGTPEESVSPNKMRTITNSSFSYLNTHKAFSQNWRIDFIGIELAADGDVKRVNHIENAIQF